MCRRLFNIFFPISSCWEVMFCWPWSVSSNKQYCFKLWFYFTNVYFQFVANDIFYFLFICRFTFWKTNFLSVCFQRYFGRLSFQIVKLITENMTKILGKFLLNHYNQTVTLIWFWIDAFVQLPFIFTLSICCQHHSSNEIIFLTTAFSIQNSAASKVCTRRVFVPRKMLLSLYILAKLVIANLGKANRYFISWEYLPLFEMIELK